MSFEWPPGAVLPNLGKIKIKSMHESGIERTVRGNITEVSKPAAECCGGLQKMGLDSLRRWRNLAGTVFPCCLAGPSNFEKKHKVWNRHGKNIRLYVEGILYNAYVRTGDAQELAPVEPAEGSWTMMEVDDGQRDKQEEC